MTERGLTEEIYKILRLAIPLIITNVAFISMEIIDSMMSGQSSSEDLAGLAIGGNIWLFIEVAMGGLITATTPRIARFLGSKQFDDIRIEAQQALMLGTLVGIIAMLFILLIVPYIPLLGATSEVTLIAQGYTRIIAFSLPFSAIIWVLFCLLEGHGMMRFTVISSLIAVVMNLILDYIFVFGKFGLPKMGAVGCAWTTTTIYFFWALSCLIYTGRQTLISKYKIYAKWPAINLERWKSILRLGVPISLAIIAEEGFFNFTALLIAPLGTEALGAHQITIQVVALILMLGLGIGQATAIFAAKSIGSQQFGLMYRQIKSGFALVILIGLFVGSNVFVFRDKIPELFTQDATISTISSAIMLFAPIYLLCDVLQIWASQSLRGFEDTRIPMMLQIISFWVIGFPLGYSLGSTSLWGESLGVYGYWIGILAGIFIGCCMLTTRLYIKSRQIYSRRSLVNSSEFNGNRCVSNK